MGNSFDIRKDLGDYLMMIRDDDMQRSITEYVTTELKHDVDCSYTILALKNVTLYNTLTETIPKEKVVSYIQEFVANFFQVINSSELESNYGTLRDNLRNIIRNTDFDRVFSKMFLAFLLSRSLVLDVDIMEVFQNLDSLHRTIGEGWWSLTTGHWPEMVQFIQPSSQRQFSRTNSGKDWTNCITSWWPATGLSMWRDSSGWRPASRLRLFPSLREYQSWSVLRIRDS